MRKVQVEIKKEYVKVKRYEDQFDPIIFASGLIALVGVWILWSTLMFLILTAIGSGSVIASAITGAIFSALHIAVMWPYKEEIKLI